MSVILILILLPVGPPTERPLVSGNDGPVTISATTYDGKNFSLTEVQSPRVVLAFLGVGCPLVQQYLPIFEQIAQEQSDVAVIGVVPNWQDTPESIAKFVQEHQLPFPVLLDKSAVLADRLGVVRTPEVVVLDQDRKIRYRGGIDDRYGINYRRTLPRNHYLQDVLDELRKGSEVSKPYVPAVGCLIGRAPEPVANASVTWYSDVLPIFQRKCQECHRAGHIAPFSLMTYEEVAGWSPMIREVVSEKRMPPWYAADEGGPFANDCRLSDQEIKQVLAWVDQGSPEGSSQDAPPPRPFVDGWAYLPDEVIPMSDKPAVIPATGPAFIQRFLIDPKWTEGRWIKGVECRPEAREAVHHFSVFVVAPSKDPLEHWSKRFLDILFGYSPGMTELSLPEGMAKYVPPGAHLLFELHYVPTGEETTDLSLLGLRYEKPERVEQLVRSRIVVNELPLEIAPYAEDAVVDGEVSLSRDTQLIAMTGHAHVRCTKFRFDAILPTGVTDTLLDIPNYDMFWQQFYELSMPRKLPKGTIIRCTAHYDNSASNPRNPDPTIRVIDGDEDVFQNEMMNGFLIVAEPKPEVLPTIADAENLFPPYKVAIILAKMIGIRNLTIAFLGVILLVTVTYTLVRRLFRRKVA